MAHDIHKTIADIDAITSVDDEAQLISLEHSMADYFAHADAASHLQVWFRLFERFPEEDAYGLFWSVLHEMEKLRNYDCELVDSVRRRPSQFPVRMLNRMLNGGIRDACGEDIMVLLTRVAADNSCPPSVQEDAKSYCEYQRNRTPSA